jgi:hypothetical protein
MIFSFAGTAYGGTTRQRVTHYEVRLAQEQPRRQGYQSSGTSAEATSICLSRIIKPGLALDLKSLQRLIFDQGIDNFQTVFG